MIDGRMRAEAGTAAMPGRAAILCACVLLLVGAGCEFGRQITDADIRTMTFVQLNELRESESATLVLVDVRSPREYQQGHIPGALNVPLPELRGDDVRLREAAQVVVYGRDWETGLAAAAAKKLIGLGYPNVHAFRGGLRQWRNEGGEVVTGRL